MSDNTVNHAVLNELLLGLMPCIRIGYRLTGINCGHKVGARLGLAPDTVNRTVEVGGGRLMVMSVDPQYDPHTAVLYGTRPDGTQWAHTFSQYVFGAGCGGMIPAEAHA